VKRFGQLISCAFFAGLFSTASLCAGSVTNVESAGVYGDWGVWSGWYWPFSDTEPPNLYSDDEALARFDAFAGSNSQSWEQNFHGPGSNPPDWVGHCHAWAGASVWESMPTASRVCGGVTFRPRDLAALMTEAYYNDTLALEINLYRPSPGLFWQYLRQEIMGQNSMHGHAMAMIGNLTTYAGEVWNFPIYQYQTSYAQDGSGTYSGTLTVWFANDGSPGYADDLGLGGQTISYTFSQVSLDGSGAPLDSGWWAGTAPSQYPTAIWRPYYPGSWSDYLDNSGLDGADVSQVLDLTGLGDALNATALKWTTGDAAWSEQTAVTHDSVSAAQSGVIGNQGTTWFGTTVTGPGTVSFWEKVSSLTNSGFLEFLVDGLQQTGSISGEVDWQLANFTVSGTGTHVLTWVYTKTSSGAAGYDSAWVGDVSWQSAPASATVVTSASPSAGGLTTGDATVTAGTSTTVCATPNPGNSFANWTANGQIVSTSSCYTFPATTNLSLVANFTLAPPTLALVNVDNLVVVSWSTNYDGYQLESCTNLSGPLTWTAVVPDPVVAGNSYCVTNSTDAPCRFYRLWHP